MRRASSHGSCTERRTVQNEPCQRCANAVPTRANSCQRCANAVPTHANSLGQLGAAQGSLGQLGGACSSSGSSGQLGAARGSSGQLAAAGGSLGQLVAAWVSLRQSAASTPRASTSPERTVPYGAAVDYTLHWYERHRPPCTCPTVLDRYIYPRGHPAGRSAGRNVRYDIAAALRRLHTSSFHKPRAHRSVRCGG